MAKKVIKKAAPKKSGGNLSITDQLEELEGWDETPERAFDDVDPGKYQTRIDSATLNNAKSTGRLQVSWELTIMNGDFRGRKLFKHDGLDTEDGRSYFRGHLAKLGHEWPDDPKDLPSLLEELIGTFAAVTVRKRKEGDGVSVYFDKSLDSDDVDDEIDGEAGAPGEPVEEVEPGEDPLTAEDVRAMDKKELKSLAKENDLEVDWKEPLEDIMDGIIEALELPGEPAEEALTADEVRDMGKKALKALAKEHGITVDWTDDLEDIRDSIVGELELEAVEPEDKTEPEEDIVCTINFKSKAVDKLLRKKFIKMAKEASLDPEDYDQLTDMLVELAGYHGVSGEFKKPEQLMKAIQKAK
jgi:hypothetical protein